MLRLAPPGFERFLQSPQFLATFGGGEANVAVALAGFGVPARYITVLPPANPIVDAFIGELRRFGVDASHIVRQRGPVRDLLRRAGRESTTLESGLRPRTFRNRPGQAWRHRLGPRAGWRDLVPHHRHQHRP